MKQLHNYFFGALYPGALYPRGTISGGTISGALYPGALSPGALYPSPPLMVVPEDVVKDAKLVYIVFLI